MLPEVVELEVNRVLPNLAERAVAIIGRETSLLRQLSGHKMLFTGPTALAIKDGIDERWKQLDGLLTRVPFTHEQAKSALNRVIWKSPPSGENNEKFRDCCIWDAAMSVASGRVVHLVTGDAAFYDGKKRESGLASSLRDEMRVAQFEIRIYPALKDFLTAMAGSAASIDEAAIGSAIIESVTPGARERASRSGTFELGEPHKPKINGYATPKSSLVAISFEVSFDLERVELRGETEERSDADLSLTGVCSYDPNLKQVSEIEIRVWSESMKGYGSGFSSTTSPDRVMMERQYGPRRMRVIS